MWALGMPLGYVMEVQGDSCRMMENVTLIYSVMSRGRYVTLFKSRETAA